MSAMERPDWTNGLQVRIGDHARGMAEGSPETTGYWDGVDADELRLKHCTECGRFLHPRRIMCSGCGLTNLEWKRVEGRGEVYTFSELHRATFPELTGSVPYFLGMVRLDEGVHLFARLFPAEGSSIQIGDRMRVDFRDLEVGGKFPVFVSETAD